MKVKLIRTFFVNGVRYRAGTHDNMPDDLYDRLPSSAKVWNGKDWEQAGDREKAPKVEEPTQESKTGTKEGAGVTEDSDGKKTTPKKL